MFNSIFNKHKIKIKLTKTLMHHVVSINELSDLWKLKVINKTWSKKVLYLETTGDFK